MIDVSIILNVHRGRKYFRRTMMSLEDAVDFALASGISVELLVVLDNSDEESARWFNEYDGSLYTRYEVVACSNGNLGASRNFGIKKSSGRFILTYDEDDLVSFNYIVSLYDTALEGGGNVFVFPEFLFGFGVSHQLCKFYGFPQLSKLSFLETHPLISRYLASRSAFDLVSYHPISVNDAFAYEDWHLNCQIVGLNVPILIAPSSVLFYRQQPSSLARQFSLRGTGQIPHSKLFEPSVYLKTCAADYERYLINRELSNSEASVKAAFLNNPVCLEAGRAANVIDSGIDIGALSNIIAYANIDHSLYVGAAYYELCQLIVDQAFTDIILISSLGNCGDEGLLIKELSRYNRENGGKSFLFLAGHGGRHHETKILPNSSVFLDLYNRFEWMSLDHRCLLALKIIQSIDHSARIHLTASAFSDLFLAKFARLLNRHHVTLYCSDLLNNNKSGKSGDVNISDFIGEHVDDLDQIVIDTNENMTIANHIYGYKMHKWHLVDKTIP